MVNGKFKNLTGALGKFFSNPRTSGVQTMKVAGVEIKGDMDLLLSTIAASSQRGYGAGVSQFDGNKYYGGLGDPQDVFVDYWALRAHSAKLFRENIYGRGIIRRLITNEINTGLHLEATPAGPLVGLSDDETTTWSDNVEMRFKLWGEKPGACDFKQELTFPALQRLCRAEALISGDVLVVLRHRRDTKIPSVQFIDGGSVQSPLTPSVRKGNRIVDGVELDKDNRAVAYWIVQQRGNRIKSKRLPAFGERTGRRIAWMVYGSERRVNAVRGEPLLSIVLQSIKELDRYRDSTLRKAVINSIIAMSVEKTEAVPSSKPVSGGAVRKDEVTLDDPDGTPRKLQINGVIPGVVVDELNVGEKLVAHESASSNVDYGAFETAVVHAIAWSMEMPPEILTLSFQNNYSASRGAVMEWKMYLDKSRAERADEFSKRVYIEWLISEVIRRKVIAPGFLEAWRDPSQYDIFGAWVSSDWTGAIKPNVDLKKEVDGYAHMVDEGFITRDRASRELTGTKFVANIKRLKEENELKAAAMRPLLELQKEFGPEAIEKATNGKGLGASAVVDIEAIAEEVAKILAEEQTEEAKK